MKAIYTTRASYPSTLEGEVCLKPTFIKEMVHSVPGKKNVPAGTNMPLVFFKKINTNKSNSPLKLAHK